jgi:glycosyltransferase involved in cell wall biosynthesis
MKILLLADGRSIHTKRYQHELKRQGIEVVLASLEDGDTVDIHLKRRIGVNFLDYMLIASQIRQLVKEINPDIVNPHFASGYGYSVALSGAWQIKPVALHCLGSDILISPGKSFLHKMRVIYALKRAGRIIVDSEYLAQRTRKLRGEVHLDIIPWGIEEDVLNIFSKRKYKILKRPLQVSVEKPYKCAVRNPFLTEFRRERLPTAQGLRLFQQALQVIVPRPHNHVYNNRFILESIGELILSRQISLTFPAWGDNYERFRKFAADKFPQGGVYFYKYLTRLEYIKFLAGFDIYLSAALSDSSPVSLLEAMAAGLFPIISDIPGNREWVSENNAILFNPMDCNSLYQSMKRIIGNSIEIEQILFKNHQKIKEKAILSNNIRQMIVIMQNMVKHAE